ncbi:hypothetical protein HK102_002745 [Quaeritorhiza haematococci]|nr:hypothetical protein HK102_002745 [Quaeritorhiza haematococci]
MGRNKKAASTSVGSDTKEDLILLPSSSFNEDEFMSTLRERYSRGQVFTKVGGNSLVYVNPVKTLESFTDSTLKQYADAFRETSSTGPALPAHVFDIATSAYYHMISEQQDQSIILSGETGSGKSEARKMIMRQLCSICKNAEKKSKIVTGISKAEIVLEAFGNARTSTNPNSSRVSRYTEFQYDDKGKLIGVKTLDYLLEKNRVACTPSDERNFNVLYYLLAGATPEEKAQFHLASDSPSQFAYLQNSKYKSVTQEDTIRMGELRDAMKTVGIGRRQQEQIYQLLAAILHLGNISFQDDLNKPQEPCTVKNYEILQLVSELLGIPAQNLETALTYKTKLVKKELCVVFLNAQDAAAQRDSLAITLYSLLFNWLMEHVNDRFCKDDCTTFVGLVDFSGFQDYKTNRFEQLLVNYANERFQSFILGKIIDEPFPDFMADQLSFSAPVPSYNSSKPTLELLTGGPDSDSSVFGIINAESVKQSARRADTKMTDKLVEAFSTSAHFITGKKPNQSFGIRHYAGAVDYETKGFIDRNTDALSPDFVSICRGNNDMMGSENLFIQALFSEKVVATERHARDSQVVVAARQPSKPSRQPSMRKPKRGNNNAKDSSNPPPPTVASTFQGALGELIDTLNETVPWFVFCVKPNEDLSTDKFDRTKVKTQLRHMNVVSVAHARSMADYTGLFTQEEFLGRYRRIAENLNLSNSGSDKERCEAFASASGWTEKEMRVGASRCYLSEPAWRSLEDELRAIKELRKQEKKAAKRGGSAKPRGGDDDTLSVASSERSRGGPRPPFADDESVYSSDADGYSNYDDDDYQSGADDTESEFRYDPRKGSRMSYAKDPEMGLRSSGPGAGDKKSGSLEGPVIAVNGLGGAGGADGKDGKEKKDGVVAEFVIDESKKTTPARRKWICCTWSLTWWIPPFCLSVCGGMKRRDIQMAWREKVALCIIIAFFCGVLLFFIIGLGRLICPKQLVFDKFEMAGKKDINDVWVYAYGRVFQVNELVDDHDKSYGIERFRWDNFLGSDVSGLFEKVPLWDRYCPGIPRPQPANWDNIVGRRPYTDTNYRHAATDINSGTQKLYLEYMNKYARARVAWDPTVIAREASRVNKLIILFGNVYDVSTYFNILNGVFGAGVETIFNNLIGQDATASWIALGRSDPSLNLSNVLRCMNEIFYIGTVDLRNSVQCRLSNYILLSVSIVIVAVVGFKFLAALQFGSRKHPEEHDKFVICQVPCYTEGPESLSKSLESLALLRYDDKRKLLFIICDGMIIGSGNDRPTPRIVLDILGVDPNIDPEAHSFQSLGEGDKQHNMGKVYSGLYEVQGRAVPFIVVVKVGKPTERQRPGNRGKRDSQMILMRFLSRVHFNAEMNPLELEIYHHMKNVIGVNPSFYEYILMVDADTEVMPDSLNRMIAAMIHDSKIMGLCGETLLSNEKDSWITMIQVYEYFISHHLAKAFESLFGSVTCLPGCFCMYRVRTPTKNVPLLIAPAVIKDYSENSVDTLHLKNLLHLGEDRYLTTLMMKHFPNLKLSFTADAHCRTNAPDRWAVLLSQRRRWINSTVHNLLELLLLPQLCGFCCFSMRFVVFLDLFSTVVQPAAIVYIGYLIYSLVSSTEVFPIISIALLAAIYGLQVIIFILKRQWAQIGWMIVYILATPVHSFYIPCYAFWHFDDFSWGNTRVVVGEGGKKMMYQADVATFDPKSIPTKKWSDHEAEMWEKGSVASRDSSSFSDGMRSQGKAPLPPASIYGGSAYGPGSVYGVPTAPSGPGSVYGYPTPSGPGSVYGGGSVYGAPAPPMPPMYPAGAPPSAAGYDPRLSTYSNMSVPGLPPTGPPSIYGGISNAPRGAGAGPTDDEILVQVRRILSTANLMTITKKQVRDELSAHFGVDLGARKAVINGFIEDILQGRL